MLVTLLKRIEKGLAGYISNMLQGKYVSITMDEWASCTNDSYHSLTVAFVAEQWKLVTLPLSDTESEG